MPRKAIDYSRTIIYKIVCNDLNVEECYVGSTTDFSKRKSGINVLVIMKNFPKTI